MNEVLKEKPPDPIFNAKRARAQEDLDYSMLRKSGDGFKSKLVGSTSPGSVLKNNTVNKTIEVNKTIAYVKNSSGKEFVESINRPRLLLIKGKKPDSSKVLSDISNRGKSSNVQWNNHPKKFLEENRSRLNKPFEEIANKEGLGSVGKVHRMGKQPEKLVVKHQARMEDELEDSEVLKALHQDMMNSGLTGNDTGEGSMDAVGDSVLDDCIEHVDVLGASNFDEVVSKF
ncbi:hypothetical protein QYF36_024138 [Acer negundo]|nr:hypothetical protein QYF36_024138 [Acer negundo]